MPLVRTRLGTLTALLLLAALLPAAPAAAQTWQVPRSADLTIVGHGYGHGHGMSQWGAEGAARKGRTHRQILRFYYPGLSFGKARGQVKVLISADTTRDVVVGDRSRLTLRKASGGRTWNLAKARPAAKKWRIKPLSGRRSEVSFRTSRWQRFKVLRGNTQLSAGGAPLTLHLPGGDRVQYRGTLRSVKGDTVNLLPLDQYLKGVVPSEVIAAAWHQQAIRAQAVAARTYAAYERAHPIAGHYQICDTQQCQVYGGHSAEYPTSNKAVEATRGTVLLAGGKPAFTQFSSSSGGWTSRGSFSYLPARKDPYDGAAKNNPWHDWTVPLTDRDIEDQWPGLGELTAITTTDRDGNGEWGGRVGTVVLEGTEATVRVSADDFRFLMGLYSTWFTVRVD